MGTESDQPLRYNLTEARDAIHTKNQLQIKVKKSSKSLTDLRETNKRQSLRLGALLRSPPNFKSSKAA